MYVKVCNPLKQSGTSPIQTNITVIFFEACARHKTDGTDSILRVFHRYNQKGELISVEGYDYSDVTNEDPLNLSDYDININYCLTGSGDNNDAGDAGDGG